jgi:hypothetical protein
MKYRGRVAIERRGGRSKSARDAVVLKTDDGEELVLRMQGGNAFSDPELDAMVGKTIEAEGSVHRGVLIMTEWEETTP